MRNHKKNKSKKIWICKKNKLKSDDSDDESDEEENGVVVSGNHIYFYSDVSIKPIRQLNQIINNLNEPGKRYPEIWIHINSYGGTIYDALSAVDTINASQTPIITLIEGMCASAATMISIAGDMRYIRPNGVLLIHQMRCGVFGKKEDVDDEIENIKNLEDKLINLYVDNSKLTKVSFKKIMKREMEFSAEKCLEFGFVDDIYTGRDTLGKRKR